MSQKWNLQDIRPIKTGSAPSRQRRKTKSSRSSTRAKTDNYRPKKDELSVPSGRSWRFFVVVATILIIVVGGLFLVSALTGRAKVMVTPQSAEVEVQSVLEATALSLIHISEPTRPY